VITAVHTVINARDAEAARAFFRDTLNLPFTDAGHGWLIFALPPAEAALHPSNQDAVPNSISCATT
jgi:catechol 2,3-dioxygenase-like lactoylglutathione lyase family enzyme